MSKYKNKAKKKETDFKNCHNSQKKYMDQATVVYFVISKPQT